MAPDSKPQCTSYQTDDFEALNIDEGEPGIIDPLSELNESELTADTNFLDIQRSWMQFLYQLLKVGGPAVAVLLAFRLIVVPLLAAGNSLVALVLAIAVSAFLVTYGITVLIKELRRSN
ncbi:MAG TPA: hypothetical protein V6C65_35695 [Allocoleopsis sp.]